MKKILITILLAIIAVFSFCQPPDLLIISEKFDDSFYGFSSKASYGLALWGKVEEENTPTRLFAVINGERKIIKKSVSGEFNFPVESKLKKEINSKAIIVQPVIIKNNLSSERYRNLEENITGVKPLEFVNEEELFNRFADIKANLVIIVLNNPRSVIELYNIEKRAFSLYVVQLPDNDKIHFAKCMFFGEGWEGKPLYSLATRRTGLIREIDVVNAWLEKRNQSNHAKYLVVNSQKGSMVDFRNLDAWRVFHHDKGSNLLLSIGFAFSIWILIRIIGIKRGLPLLRYPFVEAPFLLLLPIGMLISGYLPAPSVFCVFFITLVSMLGLYFISFVIASWLKTDCINISVLISVLIILIDSLNGCSGIGKSIFSIQMYSGARIYGMDNNYMGYLLGLSVLLLYQISKLSVDKQFYKSFFSYFLTVFVSLVLGLWFIGANAGGFAASVSGLIGAWWIFSNKKITLIKALVLLLIGSLSMFGLAIIEAKINGSHSSHIGFAMQVLLSGDNTSALNIIMGKGRSFARIWLSPYLWLGAFGLGLIVWVINKYFRSSLEKSMTRNSQITNIMLATVWVATCCVIFNDSGLVSAVITLCIATLFLLNFILGSSSLKRMIS